MRSRYSLPETVNDSENRPFPECDLVRATRIRPNVEVGDGNLYCDIDIALDVAEIVAKIRARARVKLARPAFLNLGRPIRNLGFRADRPKRLVWRAFLGLEALRDALE